MTRIATRGLMCLAITAGVVWAAGFWEKKAFTDWNEKDIRRMLTNSPWAREVRINVAELRGAQGSPAGSSVGLGPNPTGPSQAGGVGGGGGDAGGDEGGPGGGGSFGAGGGGLAGPTPSISLIVRWQSSQPIKQALVKNRFGAEAATAEEGKKYLDREEQHYLVVVSGLPGQVVRGQNPEQIKENSVLKRKKKDDIVADVVQVQPMGQYMDVNLLFPRSDPITLEDKDVELVMQLGRLKVKRKFKLKDMVFDGKLEL